MRAHAQPLPRRRSVLSCRTISKPRHVSFVYCRADICLERATFPLAAPLQVTRLTNLTQFSMKTLRCTTSLLTVAFYTGGGNARPTLLEPLLSAAYGCMVRFPAACDSTGRE